MNVLTHEPAVDALGLNIEQRSAIKARATAALAELAGRSADFNHALTLLRKTMRNEQHLLAALHTVSSTMAQHHGATSYLWPAIERLDILADDIEECGL